MKIHPLAWRRLGAVLIDAFLAGILFRLLDHLFWGWLALGLVWALFLLRDALPMAVLQRRSPGKRLLGLCVTGDHGRPCNDVASIKRNLPLLAGQFLYLVCLVIFGLVPVLGEALARVIGILAMLLIWGTEAYKVFSDPQGQRLGDLLAGTRVGRQ